MGKSRSGQDNERDPQGRPHRSGDEEIIYPTTDEVLILYGELMGIHGGDSADLVRDENLLESALARPRYAAVYEQAGIARQAASLLWGIMKNHPFLDGNKRTAHLVTVTFLESNGYELHATEDEQFDLLLKTATGNFSVNDVETWIEDHVVTSQEAPE